MYIRLEGSTTMEISSRSLIATVVFLLYNPSNSYRTSSVRLNLKVEIQKITTVTMDVTNYNPNTDNVQFSEVTSGLVPCDNDSSPIFIMLNQPNQSRCEKQEDKNGFYSLTVTITMSSMSSVSLIFERSNSFKTASLAVNCPDTLQPMQNGHRKPLGEDNIWKWTVNSESTTSAIQAPWEGVFSCASVSPITSTVTSTTTSMLNTSQGSSTEAGTDASDGMRQKTVILAVAVSGGCVVLIIIAVAVVFCVKRYRKSPDQPKSRKIPLAGEDNSTHYHAKPPDRSIARERSGNYEEPESIRIRKPAESSNNTDLYTEVMKPAKRPQSSDIVASDDIPTVELYENDLYGT